jgi:putative membrane protein
VTLLKRAVVRWGILVVAILVTTSTVPGVTVHGGFFGALKVAALLALVNLFIRPIVRLLSLPITVITLGLFSLVINALMLLLVAALSSSLSISNFGDALLAGVVIGLVSWILDWAVARIVQ